MARKTETCARSAAGKLELLLLEACVEYRNHRKHSDKKGDEKAYTLRGKIRGLAQALCWTTETAPDRRPTKNQVRAIEKDFLRRAAQVPPF